MILTMVAWARGNAEERMESAGTAGTVAPQTAPAAASAAAPAPGLSVDPEGAVFAREYETLKGSLESLNESFLETRTTVDKLNKLKISGYVQAQWQYADSAGQPSIAGGNFAAGADQRFMVRRGRLKAAYDTRTLQALTSRFVLQIDVVPGGVTLKDAYVSLYEPWLGIFSYTMGVFDRPFGFEISYSSSSRESPERSRVYQTLFPGERDLGAMVAVAPGETRGFWQHFNLKAGVFTGLGPATAEIDREQDFIGRLGFRAPFYDLNLGVDGGFSLYRGKAVAANDTVYTLVDNGVASFQASAGKQGSVHERNVYGVDAQIHYDIPIIGGFSLRGEYLRGEIPGTRGSARPYGTATTALVDREAAGWYLMWVQNLGARLQTVVKYDVFDPNTGVDGGDVGRSGSNLNANDLAIGTLGFGALWHWDAGVRIMAYYDRVTNEKAHPDAAGSLAAWTDDLSDNVFTFRVQAKF